MIRSAPAARKRSDISRAEMGSRPRTLLVLARVAKNGATTRDPLADGPLQGIHHDRCSMIH